MKSLNNNFDFELGEANNEGKGNLMGYPLIKRTIDIVLSVVLVIPVTFIIIVAAIFIKADSKGPIIYAQKRVGLKNQSFTIYKLRTMYVDPSLHKQFTGWTIQNDPRITKVGMFLRRHRIDELPQIINVFIGNMSFVGPRPETHVLTEEFSSKIKGFEKRLEVKPGITGLAQVNGGYTLNPEEKLKYDLEYINSLSFMNDLMIVIKTIKVVLTAEGAR